MCLYSMAGSTLIPATGILELGSIYFLLYREFHHQAGQAYWGADCPGRSNGQTRVCSIIMKDGQSLTSTVQSLNWPVAVGIGTDRSTNQVNPPCPHQGIGVRLCKVELWSSLRQTPFFAVPCFVGRSRVWTEWTSFAAYGGCCVCGGEFCQMF